MKYQLEMQTRIISLSRVQQGRCSPRAVSDSEGTLNY
jgi:hypothetical protein